MKKASLFPFLKNDLLFSVNRIDTKRNSLPEALHFLNRLIVSLAKIQTAKITLKGSGIPY